MAIPRGVFTPKKLTRHLSMNLLLGVNMAISHISVNIYDNFLAFDLYQFRGSEGVRKCVL